jgi:hypothetical protein
MAAYGRDDDIYMHVLRFKKEDMPKKSEIILRMSFVFWWLVGRSSYYIDGPKYGYPVGKEKLGQMVVRTAENE